MRILLFVSILLILSSIPVSATDIFFMPHEISVQPNELFNVSIWVSPTEIIDTVATDLLTWNPAVMECTGIEHGDLFEEATIWIPGTIDNAKGTILNMVWGSSVPTTNSGKYIILHFKAKQATTTLEINKQNSGIARIGEPVTFQIKNACVINVGNFIEPSASNDAAYLIITVIVIIIVIFLIAFSVLFYPKKKK